MSDQTAAIAEALAASETDQDLAGGMLIGYAVVCEWVDPHGERWLSCVSGNGAGENIPKWQARGYFHEALYHWPTIDEEDDEDDE